MAFLILALALLLGIVGGALLLYDGKQRTSAPTLSADTDPTPADATPADTAPADTTPADAAPVDAASPEPAPGTETTESAPKTEGAEA